MGCGNSRAHSHECAHPHEYVRIPNTEEDLAALTAQCKEYIQARKSDNVSTDDVLSRADAANRIARAKEADRIAAEAIRIHNEKMEVEQVVLDIMKELKTASWQIGKIHKVVITLTREPWERQDPNELVAFVEMQRSHNPSVFKRYRDALEHNDFCKLLDKHNIDPHFGFHLMPSGRICVRKCDDPQVHHWIPHPNARRGYFSPRCIINESRKQSAWTVINLRQLNSTGSP